MTIRGLDGIRINRSVRLVSFAAGYDRSRQDAITEAIEKQNMLVVLGQVYSNKDAV